MNHANDVIHLCKYSSLPNDILKSSQNKVGETADRNWHFKQAYMNNRFSNSL